MTSFLSAFPLLGAARARERSAEFPVSVRSTLRIRLRRRNRRRATLELLCLGIFGCGGRNIGHAPFCRLTLSLRASPVDSLKATASRTGRRQQRVAPSATPLKTAIARTRRAELREIVTWRVYHRRAVPRPAALAREERLLAWGVKIVWDF